MCDAGHDGLAEHFVTAAFTVASGYEKTGELLERYRELDGIVCTTDAMAAGAMQWGVFQLFWESEQNQ